MKRLGDKPLTNAERSARYKLVIEAQGLVRVEVRIRPEHRKALMQFVEGLK